MRSGQSGGHIGDQSAVTCVDHHLDQIGNFCREIGGQHFSKSGCFVGTALVAIRQKGSQLGVGKDL
jgi:hypothetical protein